MEVVTGALPSVITKLAGLAAGEYNLQKGLKGEIKFLQEELESMKRVPSRTSRGLRHTSFPMRTRSRPGM